MGSYSRNFPIPRDQGSPGGGQSGGEVGGDSVTGQEDDLQAEQRSGGHEPGGGAVHRLCRWGDTVPVPAAERVITACLPDITTPGLLQAPVGRYTDQTDWRPLHAPGTGNPSKVPGLQVDGYFPDTSTFNGTHGWNHDSQFVLRIPDAWNGGLVVTGAPGVRKQYACDCVPRTQLEVVM
jgi:hypothetical protein